MRFSMGFIVGAAVGAGAALLLTPTNGEANREWLRRKTDELAAGESLAGDIVRTVRGAINRQQLRIERAIEAGQAAAEQREAMLWTQLDLPPPSENLVPADEGPLGPPPPRIDLRR